MAERSQPTGRAARAGGAQIIGLRGGIWRRRAPAVLAVAILAVVPLGTGAGADSTFVAGSGRARASLFEIVPRTGGLEIPVSFGKALATYQGLSATATSGGMKPPRQNSADGGDCGGAQKPPGGGSGGGGAPAPPSPGGGNKNPTAFPWVSTLTVSTGDKDADTGREIDQGSFPTGSPIQGSMERQQVWATADPSARAVTTSGTLAFGKVAEILNGRTDADVGVAGGTARVAHAVTTIDRLSLFGNTVALVDVRWEATQRTGEGAKADGTFTVGKVILNNNELPALPTSPPGGTAPSAPDPLAALNTALAPTGISIVTPHLETAGGVARVTPMSIRFSDSPLGRVVLGPIVTGLQPLRDPVVGGLLALSCDFGLLVTVADVATSILTGAGGISFDFGGVTATTEGETYDNPLAGGLGDSGDLGDGGFGGSDDVPGLPDLGAVPGPDRTALSGPVADIGTGTGAPTDLGGSGSPGLGGPASPGTAAGAGLGSAPARDEVAFADPAGLFGSTSRHVPGHKGGRALAVAALAILTIAALAAADAFHLRRASRSIS